jgi:hypothetical protein
MKKHPGNTGGYEPHSYHGENQGHSKQPKGKSIGFTSKRNWGKGNEAGGTGKQHGLQPKPVANVEDGRKQQGHPANHSALAYKGNHGGSGNGVAGFGDGGRTNTNGRLGEPFKFRTGHMAQNPHGFRHEGGLKQGALRLSGVKGAHQVGCRKK